MQQLFRGSFAENSPHPLRVGLLAAKQHIIQFRKRVRSLLPNLVEQRRGDEERRHAIRSKKDRKLARIEPDVARHEHDTSAAQ